MIVSLVHRWLMSVLVRCDSRLVGDLDSYWCRIGVAIGIGVVLVLVGRLVFDRWLIGDDR